MKEENGIQIFEKGDKLPDLPKGLRTDFEIVSIFGFKIVEIEDKIMWQACTEEDYREAESKRLNIPPEKVELSRVRGCRQIAPRKCQGDCWNGFCVLAYNPFAQVYFCTCD